MPLPETLEEKLHDDLSECFPHNMQEFEDDFVHPIRDGLVKYIRFAAYTSDVGEAFRPVFRPIFVRACYGISIGYVVADVAYAGYSESQIAASTKGDVMKTTLHAGVFQFLASLALPFVAIHNTVKFAEHKVFYSHSRWSPGIRRWAPAICGLAVIPLLPLLDHPIETGVDWLFDHAQPHRRDDNDDDDDDVPDRIEVDV